MRSDTDDIALIRATVAKTCSQFDDDSYESTGARIVSARAVVRDRRRPVKVRRRSATLSLRGLAPGTYRVRLTLRVRKAGATRTIRTTRRFRTCSVRRAGRGDT